MSHFILALLIRHHAPRVAVCLESPPYSANVGTALVCYNLPVHTVRRA